MITVIKFPIYVEIESDNVDRKLVTDAANQILYPNLIRYLSDAKYQSRTVKEFRESAKCNNVSVKLLTELDLFKDRK